MQSNKTSSATNMGEKRGLKALEAWCRRVTDGYKDVRVADMTSSWRDGLAFCALIHHFRPDLIDFDSLSKENILQNNRLAFSVAEKSLGIPALLDAEDMVKYQEPDRLSIATYLSQFYQYFEGGENARLGISPSRSLGKRTLNDKGTDKIFTGSPAKIPSGGAAPTGRRYDLCHVCNHRVFILERLIVDNLLYHRTCFKCCKCESLLKPGAYVEGDQPDTYECAVCPKDEKKPDLARSPSTVSSLSSDGDAPKSPVLLTTALQRPQLAPFPERSSLKIATSSGIQRNNFLRSLSTDALSPTNTKEESQALSFHPLSTASTNPQDKFSSLTVLHSNSTHAGDAKNHVNSTSHLPSSISNSLPKIDNENSTSRSNSIVRKIKIPSAFSTDATTTTESTDKSHLSTENKHEPISRGTFLKSALPKELKPLSIGDESLESGKPSDLSSDADLKLPSGRPLEKFSPRLSTNLSRNSSSVPRLCSNNSTLSLHEDSSTKVNSLQPASSENSILKEGKDASSSLTSQKSRVPKWSVPLIQSPTYQLSSLRSNSTNTVNQSGQSSAPVLSDSKFKFEPKHVSSLASLSSSRLNITEENKSENATSSPLDIKSDTQNAESVRSEEIGGSESPMTKEHHDKETTSSTEVSKGGTKLNLETDDVDRKLPKSSLVEKTESTCSDIRTSDNDSVTSDSKIGKEMSSTEGNEANFPSENADKNVALPLVYKSAQNNKPKTEGMITAPEVKVDEAPKTETEMPSKEHKMETSSKIDASDAINYPDDLNPFGDEEEEEESENKTKDVDYPDDLNPFGDSEDDTADDHTGVSIRPISSSTPTKAQPKQCNYDESLNPFGSSDEDDDDNTSLRSGPDIGNHHRASFTSTTSRTDTEEKSNASAAPNRSTIKRPRKKPPPPPPPMQMNSTNGKSSEANKPVSNKLNDSPMRSLSPARLTPSPRLHKKKAAPKPPVLSPNNMAHQDSSLECDSFQDSGVNSEASSLAGDVSSSNVKAAKDLNNKRLASMESDSTLTPPTNDIVSTNKQSSNPPKKKKRPAPPVPIPQRRTIKKIPLKEIMSEMEEIEEKQQELEKHGIELEMMIRDRNEEEPTLEEEELIMQLFELVNQKNALFRRQAELMYLKRSQRLEEEQADLEYKIRCLMTKPVSLKGPEDAEREEELLQRLIDVVEQRNEIVESIEMDRKRKIVDDLMSKASPMSPMFDSKMEVLEDLSIHEHITHKQTQMYGKHGTLPSQELEKKSEKHKHSEKLKNKDKKKKGQAMDGPTDGEDKKTKKKKKSWF